MIKKTFGHVATTRWAALAIMAALSLEVMAQGRAAPAYPDNFHWLNEFNKAAVIVTVEEKVIPRELGKKVAVGLTKVIEDGAKPGARRPGDYLQYEPLLVAEAGADASRIHSGRSRQDILAATRRVMLRDRLLNLQQSLNNANARVIALATEHADTIVPGYTNGVQAQPTTLGHYLLAYSASLGRTSDRLAQAYARLNQNPLGTAVYGTSSFPINRERLAVLLGFDGLVVNSYDATQLSTMDVSAELAAATSIAALAVGGLVNDIHTQYHQTRPWLLIQEGANTHTSSIMPQKRNPTILNNLRLTASTVVGDAQTYFIQSHNVTPGMPDYKREQVQRVLEGGITMFDQLASLLGSLAINKARAAEEVAAEYSTTTELADVLQREVDVPFRIGHHFASELVTIGRARSAPPAAITMADVAQAWDSTRAKYPEAPARFPLAEKRFRESLSPEGMLAAAKGTGGPQPASVKKMLDAARQKQAADVAWLTQQRKKLDDATKALNAAFLAIANQ